MLKTNMKMVNRLSIPPLGNHLSSATLFVLLLAGDNTFAQGQGSWGGGGGLFGFLMVVIGIIFLIWMWMIHSLFKHTNISAKIRFFLVPVIAFAPIAFMIIKSKIESIVQERRHEEIVLLRDGLRNIAENYLIEKCKSDRKITNLTSISSEGGMLIAGNLEEPPEIIDLPTKPNLSNLENFQSQGRVSDLPKYYYTSQFFTPLGWTVQQYETQEYLRLGTRFVERSNSGEKIKRTANYDWWSKNADKELLSELLKAYGNGTQLAYDYGIEFRVENSQAKYVVQFRDISTREDREHWVGRGRIRLFDIPNDKLIAEYVGFSHIYIPGSQHGPYSDEDWNQRNASCPGVESKYVKRGEWDAKSFFFKEVVQIKTNADKSEKANSNRN